MAKYTVLGEHLRKLDRSKEHTLTFAEIEHVLGFRLPKSARTHPAWWANQKNGRHVQAVAWHVAGWHTKETNIELGEVTFKPAPTKPRTAGEFVRALTIADAKKSVALQFGVRPQDVEIIIRG